MNIIFCSMLAACLSSQALAMDQKQEQALIADISNNRPYEGYGWSCPSIDSRGRDSNDLIYQNPRLWVKQRKINLLKQFLERGGNPNQAYPDLLEDGPGHIKKTPLAQAIIMGYSEAIEIMLQHNAGLDNNSFSSFEMHCLKPAELASQSTPSNARSRAITIFKLLHSKTGKHGRSAYLDGLSERVKELDPKYAKQKFHAIIVAAHQRNHPIISLLPVELLAEIEQYL